MSVSDTWTRDPALQVYRNKQGHIVTVETLVNLGGWEAVEAAIRERGPASMIDGTFGRFDEVAAKRLERIVDGILGRIEKERKP